MNSFGDLVRVTPLSCLSIGVLVVGCPTDPSVQAPVAVSTGAGAAPMRPITIHREGGIGAWDCNADAILHWSEGVGRIVARCRSTTSAMNDCTKLPTGGEQMTCAKFCKYEIRGIEAPLYPSAPDLAPFDPDAGSDE